MSLGFYSQDTDQENKERSTIFLLNSVIGRVGIWFFPPKSAVDSDDAMGGNTSILSSPTPPSAGPYGKEIGGTPPQSPSVSTTLSGAGYEKPTSLIKTTTHNCPHHCSFQGKRMWKWTNHKQTKAKPCLFPFVALHVRAVRWWGCKWTTGHGKAQRRRKRARRET